MDETINKDKMKRTEKLLRKKGLKGLLKPVNNKEYAHFVITEDRKCAVDSLLIKTEDFNRLIDRGKVFLLNLFTMLLLVTKEMKKL